MDDDDDSGEEGVGKCTKCDCQAYAPEHTGGHCKNTNSRGEVCDHKGTEHGD